MADIILFVLKETVLTLISVLSTAMLVRAVLGLFDPMHEWGISAFLFAVTEPLILPYRKLCAKNHWLEGGPLDGPFFLTVITLVALEVIIGMI